jgi:maleate cis-trans isomerase
MPSARAATAHNSVVGIIFPDPEDHGFELFGLGDWYRKQMISEVDAITVSSNRGGAAVSSEFLDWLADADALIAAGRELADRGVEHASFACTSGSFYRGLAFAEQQSAQLTAAVGIPVSSTSLDIIAALRAIGAGAVEVAAAYPPEIAAAFRRFLADANIEICAIHDLDRPKDMIRHRYDLGAALIETLRHSPFDCPVVVPATAMNSLDHISEWEGRLGRTIITANSATAWHLLRLAGNPPRATSGGRLFESPGEPPLTTDARRPGS